MRYVPSPIPLNFNLLYTATSNRSGRMQYHKIVPGRSKARISRTEFIEAYNTRQILAIRPLPGKVAASDFQIEFYT